MSMTTVCPREGREGAGDARPLDSPLIRPRHHRAHGQGRPGIARAYHGVGLAGLDQVEGHADGGIPLAPQNFHGRFVHARELGAVMDFHQPLGRIPAIEFGPDAVLVAYQDHGPVELSGGRDSAFHDHRGSAIASHGVHGDFHDDLTIRE